MLTEKLRRALNWGDQSQKVEFLAVPLIPQFHIFCHKLIGPMKDYVQIEMRSAHNFSLAEPTSTRKSESFFNQFFYFDFSDI